MWQLIPERREFDPPVHAVGHRRDATARISLRRAGASYDEVVRDLRSEVASDREREATK